VLVDFWATWCGPCRPEVPNLVKAYQKYRSKGFEIIGISLDRSKKDFFEFTEKEKMTWRHYFDGLYWENKVARAYGVRAIPAMYLVGKDGKVISNNVRGGRLETILAKELGGENK
jgi:thiol-disulfide isomerase/thioredoxin